MTEFRKQISLFLPLSEWKAVRREAARRRIPMTELCREWLKPYLAELCNVSNGPERDNDSHASLKEPIP